MLRVSKVEPQVHVTVVATYSGWMSFFMISLRWPPGPHADFATVNRRRAAPLCAGQPYSVTREGSSAQLEWGWLAPGSVRVHECPVWAPFAAVRVHECPVLRVIGHWCTRFDVWDHTAGHWCTRKVRGAPPLKTLAYSHRAGRSVVHSSQVPGQLPQSRDSAPAQGHRTTSNGTMRTSPESASRRQSLSSFLEASAHAYTRAELTAQWSRNSLDTALRAGTVVRALPDVYISTTHAHTSAVRGEALNLWAPQGLVTGALAASLYLPHREPPAVADLVAIHGQHLRAPAWVRLHQTTRLPSLAHLNGVACTPPARTALDVWRYAKPKERRADLYAVLWDRLCSAEDLIAEVQNTARVVRRLELLSLLVDFTSGATSPLEVMARRDIFADARFAELEWQVPLRLGGRIAVADILHRRAKLVVELDGRRFHSSPEARHADHLRDIELLAAGYSTFRVTWADATRRPEWCRQKLLAAVRSRLSQGSPQHRASA